MDSMHMILVAFALLSVYVSASTTCDSYINCVSCTNSKLDNIKDQCVWSEIKNKCQSPSLLDHAVFRFDDTCPVVRHNSPADAEFLSNWMGSLVGSGNFDKLTLLDLSLPGTHDTLTYDLSTKVSDGGADDQVKFAEILHKYEHVVPDYVTDFIRKQAQTQGLSILQQLDNGIRFLDLRMMYEYSDKSPDWYSLHFMQSNQKMMAYFTTIRDWLIAHPSEVVVMWVSKHGSECATGNNAYPKTPIDAKQAYWAQVESLFDGLLLSGNDKSIPPVRVNETTVVDMVARNARAVFYVSDFLEMTGSSSEVLDGCLIDNLLGPSVDAEPTAAEWEQNIFKTATVTKFHDKKEQKLMLMSLATGVPTAQVVTEGDISFLHHGNQNKAKIASMVCTKAFNIPDFEGWCPPTLLDVASLENFYKQVTLDQAYTYRDFGWSFPNAIYINGVDEGGTIRTGTQVMWADDSTPDNVEHATTKYAYVDTMVAFNLYLACNLDTMRDDGSAPARQCKSMKTQMDARRAQYPVTRWNDSLHGRHATWPDFKTRGQ